MSQKYREFPYRSFPQHLTISPIIDILHQSAFVTTDEPVMTYY